MKRLMIYLQEYKKECVLAPLFKMLEAVFELFVPLVMAAVIDRGIAGKDTGYIARMCLVMVLLGAAGLACSVTAQYFSAKAACGFGANVRHALFSHIQRLSFSSLDKAGASALITRMTSDANQAQSGVNMTLRLFLRSPFIVFGAAGMAFSIDAKSSALFLIAILLLSAVVFGVTYATIPLYKKVQEKLDAVMLLTRENLTGARVIRAFHMEEKEVAEFSARSQALAGMQMFAGKISGLMNPVTFVIVNAALAGMIWKGALQVDIGALTQGEVVALVNYMGQILVELVKLANLIVTITKALACANRIGDALAVPEGEREVLRQKTEELPRDEEEMVVFSHVSLAYEGAGAEALTDISFMAKRGETVGVIGGTGSGKTSLAHLIPGFYPHTEGSIRIDGRPVESYSKEELRGKIGIVLQKPVLFAGTVRENLLWGRRDASDRDLEEALSIAQAREVVEKKEGNLSARISQGGKNFSGGQKQRLTIARALAREPDILILDDAASALDYATDAALRKAIAGMRRRPTVFVVSQRTSSIRHADKILVLEDGKLAGAGTHEELLRSCEVYREIHESQYQEEGGREGVGKEAASHA